MDLGAIRFEDEPPPLDPDPARMDVACFIGLVAERAGAALPAALAEAFRRTFGDSEARLAAPGRLLERPVTVRSPAGFDALFDGMRIEAVATVQGGPLPDGLPPTMAPVFAVAVDGRIREVPLDPAPATPVAARDRIAAALPDLDVTLTDTGGGPALRLALRAAHGPGLLTVLPHPGLGFPQARRAGQRRVPTVMVQAVRQFFASGGRQAVILRTGDPIPYDAGRARRRGALAAVAGAAAAEELSRAEALAALRRVPPGPVDEPATRRGPAHAYGLPDVTFLCLPDLPELCAPAATLAAAPVPGPDLPATFAECLPDPGRGSDAAASPFLPPAADAETMLLWSAAVERVLGILRLHERGKLLVVARPRLEGPAPVPQSAFLQLVDGWSATLASGAAPGGLMAPDAILAGHLAASALARGAFLSAAARPVAGVLDVEPGRRSGGMRLVADRRGVRLSADLTTSADPAWADGPVSRLMALLLRQAARVGEDVLFEPAGPALRARVAAAMTALLEAVWRAGALAGETPADSFSVRCDDTTMSPDDVQAGRLVAEVSFQPARPVRRITVRIPVTATPPAAGQGGPQ